MNIVICGGGVIGASIAYFLGERGASATLMERADIAGAASGKSGGDEVKCREIARICAALSSRLDGADVLRTQACYRPICADAMPLLGPVPDVPGAYVATGHNCWGMLNAPASGRAMAELLCDGTSSSVDLAPFDPARLEAVRSDDAADQGSRIEGLDPPQGKVRGGHEPCVDQDHDHAHDRGR